MRTMIAIFLALLACVLPGCTAETSPDGQTELMVDYKEYLDLQVEVATLKGQVLELEAKNEELIRGYQWGTPTVTEEEAIESALKINTGAEVKAARIVRVDHKDLSISIWIVDLMQPETERSVTVILNAVTGEYIWTSQSNTPIFGE